MAEQRVPWNLDSYLTRVRASCFVCEFLAEADGYEHHVIFRSECAVAFLAKFPSLRGHVLVAPVEHREHVVGDFSEEEYVELQRVVHRVGRALTRVVKTERLYVVSLGSQQGNRHVHWHLLPLPAGVPYEHQQMAVFDEERGWLDVDASELEGLASEISLALGSATRSDDI